MIKFDKCEHCLLPNIDNKDTKEPYICGECYLIIKENKEIYDLRTYLSKIIGDDIYDAEKILNIKIEKRDFMIIEQIKRKQLNKIFEIKLNELETLIYLRCNDLEKKINSFILT